MPRLREERVLVAGPAEKYTISQALWDNYEGEYGWHSQLSELAELYHVAHPSDARSILNDEGITKSLVFDKSKLLKHRVEVVWVSPNVWGPGSMYGTVAFVLPISQLEGKHFYWVEPMTVYRPTALRILVSENPKLYESLPVEPLDVEALGAPLYRTDAGTWIRLTKFNYELMFDEDFAWNELSRITFFDHHRKYCNKHGAGNCSIAGSKAREGALIATCHVLALADLEYAKLMLKPGEGSARSKTTWAVLELEKRLESLLSDESESKIDTVSAAAAQVRAALLFLSERHHQSKTTARTLLALTDAEMANRGFRHLVRTVFGKPFSDSIWS
tara:strand:+ start:7906 stop:8898 length:993 start_codon:yes stop_codon:yes gene_type:complete